jgi:hypothetical protein
VASTFTWENPNNISMQSIDFYWLGKSVTKLLNKTDTTSGTITASGSGTNDGKIRVVITGKDLANRYYQRTFSCVLPEAAPTATDLSISGTLAEGETLTGNYTYSDVNGDLEGTSTFQWYRYDDLSKNGQTALSTAQTYTLVAGDQGKYISFEVTPVALTGTTTGTAVLSTLVGAVATTPASPPVISGVAITNGDYKVGDAITVTITADGTGYTAGTITINGVAITGFTDNADNTYTVTYTVVEGNTDRASAGVIPISVILSNSGVTNTAYTSAPTGTVTIDANSPTNQDTVFAASDAVVGGATVTIVSSGDATNNVWFAPSGTTTFSAGATMTTAAGNATSILAPTTTGTYYMYVIDSAGNYSAQSTATLTVDTPPVISGVAVTNGDYKVGDAITVTITADGTGYTAGSITINGVATTGFTDNSDSTYTVNYTVVEGNTDRASAGVIPISVVLSNNGVTNTAYTTAPTGTVTIDANSPTNQDTVFAASDTVIGGATVTIVSSGDATNNVWFAPTGTTTFSAGATMTTAAGDATSILAPTTTGTYYMYVIDSAGNYSAQSSATLTVGTPPVISGVVITNGDYKVGDAVTVTITADGTGYTAGAITINGVATTGFTDNSDNTYTVTYTVVEGNTDRASAGVIPISVVLSNSGANNIAYTTAPTGTVTIDANSPTNQDTVFSTSDAVIGGATVTIVSSGDATNNVWFAPTGTTTFSAGATMTTAAGDATSILAPTTIGTYYMYVIDNAGNYSAQSTAILTVGTAPVISGVAITNGDYKVGDAITATITADGTGYTAGAITINGVATTGFTDNSDNTYTVTYTVVEGNTDRASAGVIPISVVLDKSGITNTAYTTAPTGTVTIDANTPTNQDTVFAASDTVLGGATVTIVSSGDATNNVWFAPSGTTSFSAGATMTTAAGDATSILAPATIGTYYMYVIDSAGNYSAQSTAILTVDTAPVISGVAITNGDYKVGDAITATITADGTGYTAGAITINGVATTGFTDNSDSTYTVTYTVVEGNTDRASAGVIPISVVLDNSGLTNTAYTTAPTGTVTVDANSPQTSSVTFSDETVVNTPKVDSDDTITIVFNEALDPATIEGTLTLGGSVTGTLVTLIGYVGSFATPLAVGDATDGATSSLGISADGLTVTITATGFTPGTTDTAPSGTFTPKAGLTDSAGNTINTGVTSTPTGAF